LWARESKYLPLAKHSCRSLGALRLILVTIFSLPLTAIPEPATWIGGASAVGLLAFSQRRRFARLIKRAV
jgi:hypothetical protein